jgi:hypothetical protein
MQHTPGGARACEDRGGLAAVAFNTRRALLFRFPFLVCQPRTSLQY